MNKRTLSLVVLLLLVLALGLMACGGGKEEEAAPAETPAEAEAPAGNPENGQQVFLNKGGCGACHKIEGVEGAVGMVGPELTHIATLAEDLAKEAGVANGAAFIRQSIIDPNAYIAKECPTGDCIAGTMPQTFKDQLTDEELNDVIAFLMEQK